MRDDDSYPKHNQNSVNHIFVVSLGSILGANARWPVSTYLPRVLGPVFP